MLSVISVSAFLGEKLSPYKSNDILIIHMMKVEVALPLTVKAFVKVWDLSSFSLTLVLQMISDLLMKDSSSAMLLQTQC